MSKSYFIILLMILVTSVPVLGDVKEATSINVKGFVYGPDGEPIQKATISLWGFYQEAKTTTDINGHYELLASTTENLCQLFAFSDSPVSDGYDLLPSQKSIETYDDVKLNVNFTLLPGATIQVIGQLKPVELTSKVNEYAFEVVDILERKVIEIEGHGLIYGTGMNVLSYFLDLDTMILIVPADTPFALNVSSSYQYERYPPSSSWRPRGSMGIKIDTFNEFSFVEGEGFILKAGEILELDIRRYSLIADTSRLYPILEEMEVKLSDVEEQGFFISLESRYIQEAKEFLSWVDDKTENGEYESAYVDLRQAYLKLLSVRESLEAMIYEADFSLKVLLVFIAVTSVALGGLLTKNDILKLLITICSFTSLALYLRHVFPGGAVIEIGSFFSIAAASLLGALLVFYLLPRVLGDAVGEDSWAIGGTLVTVFSIGKRSLKRRKFRSFFTLAAILTLTMSFVTLTSLSTSYGLIFNRSGVYKPDIEGIMVRMPHYTPNDESEKGFFSAVIDATIEWAWGNEGVVNVAKLAESIPSLRPYGRIEEWSIFGVLGLQPYIEPLMSHFDDAIVDGEPLREEGDCLLHKYINSYAGLKVGDKIIVGDVALRIVGFFEGISRIIDVDGETILPEYQFLVSPDPFIIDVRVCNEAEVVITTLETALKISQVYVSRIDVKLESVKDLDTIGKSMALSREYRIWISEGEESHIAYMGNQIGGKGFPIIVPWAIVILNVISTMLNSMFERRREIDILSSIGLNPMHIAGVFLAEASILGIIGGSIGYLMGLGFYPVMKGLEWAPVVSQKISAVWLLAALGIAIISVVLGSVIALGWSVGMTPSLTRRWKIGEQEPQFKNEWSTRLPVILSEDNIDDFLSYIKNYFKMFTNYESIPRIDSMKISEEGGIKMLSFIYNLRETSINTTWSSNIITFTRDEENICIPTMVSRGDKIAATKTGTFIRKISIRWSINQGKKL